MDMITEFLTPEMITGIIGFIVVAVAGKLGIDFITEIEKIFETIKQAFSEDSDQGSELSEAEKQVVKDELFGLALKFYGKYRKTVTGRLVKGISKFKFWG